jgi:hypothetical protein
VPPTCYCQGWGKANQCLVPRVAKKWRHSHEVAIVALNETHSPFGDGRIAIGLAPTFHIDFAAPTGQSDCDCRLEPDFALSWVRAGQIVEH